MRLLTNPLRTAGNIPFPRLHKTVICCFRFSVPGLRGPPRARFSSHCVDRAFAIPVGNNGGVSLSVTQPSIGTHGNESPNVILYLPSIPLLSQSSDLAETNPISPQHVLASITSSTVVTINYRLGPIAPAETHQENPETAQHETAQLEHYKYPTPVHDTLAGFDWTMENLQPAQLSVLGTHTGGSLALMLALTEAQTVHSVAALEPICDWTELDEYCTLSAEDAQKSPSSSRRKAKSARSSAPSDLLTLLKAREIVFTKPEKYFDAFASPLLFLRSAGKDVPSAFPEYLTGSDYPVPILKSNSAEDIEDDNLLSTQPDFDNDSGYSSASDENPKIDPANGMKKVRRRKALSRWPPYGLDYGLSGANPHYQGMGRLQMTLPWVHICTPTHSQPSPSPNATTKKEPGNETVLAGQATKMVDVMRRACFWGREKGLGKRGLL